MSTTGVRSVTGSPTHGSEECGETVRSTSLVVKAVLRAVGCYLDAGDVPMITTGAPSELIFACRIMNGTSPGFAHWWTRP